MSDGIVFINDDFVAPADATMSIFDVGFVWGDTALVRRYPRRRN